MDTETRTAFDELRTDSRKVLERVQELDYSLNRRIELNIYKAHATLLRRVMLVATPLFSSIGAARAMSC